MSRKYAREQAFKLIYEYCIAGRKNQISYDNIISSGELTADDILYLEAAYKGVTDNYPALTAYISGFAEGFSLERIYKIDLAILMLAVYEIKSCPDIPAAVSVNEAVELAKAYSTEKSGPYINGILAKIIKDGAGPANNETEKINSAGKEAEIK